MSTNGANDAESKGSGPSGADRDVVPRHVGVEAPSDGATRASPGASDAHPLDLLPGSITGYEILREIHRGGQGVVYQALQKSTKRKVAIKVLREGLFASAADRARFEREVEILAQLNHPNIVTIHDSGVAAGCHYLVMDYISGQSLDAYLRSGPPSIEQTLRLFAKICSAVNAAHLRGIVHRDLKPGNIRIDAEGEPHILDFGLAKVMASGEAGRETMTATGQFMGSLPWASPEQAEAVPSRIDPRTDVYALGVILYQMLTGRFPYEVTGNLRDVLDHILRAEPVRPRTLRPELDAELETIVLHCLHKDRARRYETAGALVRDVARYLAGEPIAARRDSVLYLLRARTAAGIRRHPAFVCAWIVVVVTLVAHTLGSALVYRWTPAGRLFDRLAGAGLGAPRAAAPFESIRVVVLCDRTDLSALAAQTGLDPDRLVTDPQGLRPLHAELMKRLAAAGARVVAWDIFFHRESTFDADFAAGIQALRDVGGEVVLALDAWSLNPESATAVTSGFAANVRWGATPAGLGPRAPWHVYLAVQRGPADPLPSLAAAAFAAYRHPGTEWDLRLDPDAETLTIVYSRRVEQGPQVKRSVGNADVVPVSGVRPAEWDDSKYGLERGDAIAYYLIDLPDAATLSAATLDYEAVFTADREALRRQVGGRIVLVGDARGDAYTFTTPNGRRVWGMYAHATAIDMLLRGAAVRIAGARPALAATAGGALLGLLAGWFVDRRRGARSLALTAGCVLLLVLSLLAAWYGRTLYNPLVAALALVLACELGAVTHGVHRSRRN